MTKGIASGLPDEPGYMLGLTLLGFLVAPQFYMSAGPKTGWVAIFNGMYLLYVGALFLASFYFSHKTFLLRCFAWVCFQTAWPGDRRKAAFFYFALCLAFAIGFLFHGLFTR